MPDGDEEGNGAERERERKKLVSYSVGLTQELLLD